MSKQSIAAIASSKLTAYNLARRADSEPNKEQRKYNTIAANWDRDDSDPFSKGGDRMDYATADVKAIAEVLRNLKRRGRCAAVLVGAGMSESAGIPLASGMMQEIEKRFSCAAASCHEKTYPAYMAALAPGERRDLIGSFVDKARVNLGHLYLGALVYGGYVDHILTTNFDPLIIRSLALFNTYPAVYDFAASQTFIPGEAAERSVFHLHGQRDGFVLLNTKEEMEKLSGRLGDLFMETGRKRAWIVIGYSGDNDPVFKRLAEADVFHNRLYWVGHKDKEPAGHVYEGILSPKDRRYAFYVKGHDADSFFVALARELKLEDPKIVRKPFTYLGEAITNIVDKCCIDDKETDLTAEARRWVDAAIAGFEQGKGFQNATAMKQADIARDELVRRARDIWIHGKYDEIDALASDPMAREIPEVRLSLSIALYNWCIDLEKLAETKSGEDEVRLRKQIIEKYRKSIGLNPTQELALVNLAAALVELVQAKQGADAEELLIEAMRKSEDALKLLPNDHKPLGNWGNALLCLAKMKHGEDAEKLFEKSTQKYEALLKIKPDDSAALEGWGLALAYLARMKDGTEREALLKVALQKCQAAEDISKGEGSYNQACIRALCGDTDRALLQLEAALKAGSKPFRSHILDDPDLQSIRPSEKFKELLDKYRPE